METNKRYIIIGLILALSIGGIIASLIAEQRRLDIVELQQENAALQRDLLATKKAFHAQGYRHLTAINGYRVELNRLTAAQATPKWEFYRGVYAGCVRFFWIAESGYAPAKIEAICNAFTKEHYGLDMYQWPGPPGIDKNFIEGRVKGRTS